MLRIAEKEHNNNILFANKNNLSKLWKSINLVINRNTKHSPNGTFKHNNCEITDSTVIAKNFNNFFLNLGKQDTCKNPRPLIILVNICKIKLNKTFS